MKKFAMIIIVVLITGWGMVFSAFADHDMGQMIQQSRVGDYSFMYHLLNKAGRDKMMKGMEGMDMPGMSSRPDITHHLMVFITSQDGKPVSGKIGFLITDPDGKEQKTLTMGMQDGYGADISFQKKGIYKIKAKAVINEKTIMDEFTYEVK